MDGCFPLRIFQKKFAQRVRLQSYLEEHVLAASADPDEQQKRYAAWLNNAWLLANVVYYDKALERPVKTPVAAVDAA